MRRVSFAFLLIGLLAASCTLMGVRAQDEEDLGDDEENSPGEGESFDESQSCPSEELVEQCYNISQSPPEPNGDAFEEASCPSASLVQACFDLSDGGLDTIPEPQFESEVSYVYYPVGYTNWAALGGAFFWGAVWGGTWNGMVNRWGPGHGGFAHQHGEDFDKWGGDHDDGTKPKQDGGEKHEGGEDHDDGMKPKPDGGEKHGGKAEGIMGGDGGGEKQEIEKSKGEGAPGFDMKGKNNGDGMTGGSAAKDAGGGAAKMKLEGGDSKIEGMPKKEGGVGGAGHHGGGHRLGGGAKKGGKGIGRRLL